MPLGMKVGLGPVHIVLDGDLDPSITNLVTMGQGEKMNELLPAVKDH